MKKFLSFIFTLALLAIIGYSAYFIYQKSLSPCDKPLEYSIGRFDTQFGVSQTDFKSYIAEAASVWEKALGRKEFIYNPNAAFKINLIYDERQLATVQKQKTEFGLSAVEDVFKSLDTQFNTFKSQYDQKVSLYQQSLSAFESEKSAYNARVAYWNQKGGIPKSQFDALEAERQSLNSQAQSLNSQAAEINDMTKQLQTLLDERNAKAAEYNKVVEDYNKKYGSGLEFNQAEYVSHPPSGGPGEINVYEFTNKKDLILALAHELGHALGMNHVENPKSIMYYITGVNVMTSPTPTAEDLAELNRVCKL